MGLESLGGWLGLLLVLLLLGATTSFVKASVVFGALRVGLGAEAVLTRPVVALLAVWVTVLTMSPELAAMFERAQTVSATPRSLQDLAPLWEPLRAFVVRHADPVELAFFADLQDLPASAPLVEVSAFLATELQEAVQMAVVILVPLVLVDLLVAQALLLLGLSSSPPVVLVLPLKLMLFLAVGGWDVVVGGLVEGYRG